VKRLVDFPGMTRVVAPREEVGSVVPSFGGREAWKFARQQPATTVLPLREFAKRVVDAVLVSVLILLLIYLLGQTLHVLLEAFAGVLFAVFLATLSDWLSRQ